MSKLIPMLDSSDGYKLFFNSVMNSIDSLKSDIKNVGDRNDTDHNNIRKEMKGLSDKMEKFKVDIREDWHELDKKVAIRGAIAGFIPSLLSIIVMLIAIWKFILPFSAASVP